MRNRSGFIRLLGALAFAATAGPSASSTLGPLPASLPLQKLDLTLQNRVTSDEGDAVVWGTGCSDPSCQPVARKNH